MKRKWLRLSPQSLTSPPPEIASRGLAAIQEYFDALADKDATKLYEAKLIIVGEGEVGKTCLAYKLTDPTFDQPGDYYADSHDVAADAATLRGTPDATSRAIPG